MRGISKTSESPEDVSTCPGLFRAWRARKEFQGCVSTCSFAKAPWTISIRFPLCPVKLQGCGMEPVCPRRMGKGQIVLGPPVSESLYINADSVAPIPPEPHLRDGAQESLFFQVPRPSDRRVKFTWSLLSGQSRKGFWNGTSARQGDPGLGEGERTARHSLLRSLPAGRNKGWSPAG